MNSTLHYHQCWLKAGMMSGLIAIALYATDIHAAPPIGSTCTSSGNKQICKYPNGTTWECDAQLNSCTRIGIKAPTGAATPGGMTAKPLKPATSSK